MDRRVASAGVDCESADLRQIRSHDRGVGRLDGVQRLEMPAVATLVLGKEPGDVFGRDRSVLETTLRKHWHLQTEHRTHAARHDFSLERVQPRVRALGQLGEGNRLRYCDDRWPRIRARALETDLTCAGRTADSAATVST